MKFPIFHLFISGPRSPQSTRKTIRLLPVIALSAIGTISGLAASITWNGGGSDNNWSSVANWGGATPANNDALTFVGGTRLINSNNWLSSIGTVTFSTGGFTISGNALTLNGDFANDGNNIWGINSTLGAARIFTSNSGTLTLSGSITNAGFLTTIAGTGNTQISGVLGGSGGLSKTGTGTLTLSSANTYTGATSIAPGGTLSISQDGNLGTAQGTATAGSLVIDSTGTLATTATFTLDSNRGIKIGPTSGAGAGIIDVATGTILTYGGIITSSGAGTGGLTKAGAGTLLLSGANTYTGTTSINAGILQLGGTTAIPSGTGKGDVVVDATLDLNGNSVTVNGLSSVGSAGVITSSVAGAITFTAGGNNGSGTYKGVIQNGSGTLAFTKTGTGAITLSGSNTFTGGVTINGGTLQLANAGALNSSTPNSLIFGPSAAVGTKLQLNGNSVTIGALATNATPGTVVVENANAGAATLTINQASSTTFAGVLQNGTGGGVLSITKQGTGTLTLSGTNLFTGTTTVSDGTLALANGAAIADTAAVFLANVTNACLLLYANETIGSLAGGGSNGGNVNLQSYTLTTGGANTDTTYSGVISGTGALIKAGSGTLTLAASNTYSGNTTVSGGTLKLGVNNALQYGVGQGDLTVNGTLDLNGRTLNNARINGLKGSGSVTNSSGTAAYLTVGYGDASSTFSGSLTDGVGTVALAKTGTGTLTLSGNSNYTGTTTITQGVLSVSNLAAGGNLGSGTSAVVLGDAANAGVLSYTGTSASFTRGFTVNASGGGIDTTTAGQTLTLSTGNVATSGAFTIGGAGNTLITSNITGAGSLNKSGAGTLTLSGTNTYSGATNIKNGTVVLAVSDTGLKATTTLTLGDATANTNGVLKLDRYSQTLAGLTVAGSGTGNRVTGGNATLSTLTVNNAGGNTFAGILGGTGPYDNNLALVKTGAGTLTLAGTNTFTGGATVTGGTLSISRDNNLGGTSSGVILNGGALSANASFTLGSGRGILLGPASGSGSGTLDVTTGNTLTYAGGLANNGAGTGSLIKTSAGALILSGTSTYGGATTIKDGTLSLGINNALPTGTSLTLGDSTTGGILRLNGKEQELAGLTAFGGGTNRIVNGNLTLSTLTLNIAGTANYSAYLGGTGTNENNFNLNKTGLGTLTLSGANTYAGTTTVAAGTLKIGSAVTIPSGAGKGNLALDGTLDLGTYGITINGLSGAGTVTTSAASTVTLTVGSNDQPGTFSGVIQNGSGTLALTKTGTGTLTLTGANTYSGVTTISSGGTLKVGRIDAIPFGTDKSTVALGGTLDLNANSITLNGLTSNGTVLSHAAGAVTLSLGAADTTASFTGIIKDGSSGTIALTKIGTGTITLAGASTYSGHTTIAEGTLKLNGTSAIPSGTGKGNVAIAAGSFLDLNARNNTINGLTGLGTITNSGAGAATLTVGANNQTSTFDGLLQNGTSALALGKTGTGTLTLTGNNTFTGGVTISGGSGVNAGVLQIGSDGALNSTTPNTVAFGSNVAAGTKLQLNGHSITLGGLTTSTSVGSPVVENASATAVSLTISNGAANTYGGVIQDGSGGGSLSIIKTNSGVLSLAAFNTYTGTTTILQGTILAGGDGAFGAVPGSPTAGNIVLNGTLANPAILSINGNSTINSNRGIALGTTSSSGLGTLDVTATKTLTYGGILANNGGTGGLVKTGLGTLALTGTANGYSGGTTVSSGLINITVVSGTPLGANINTNNIAVNAGGNLSLSNTSNKGTNQTITVTSSNSALGGIGFSNIGLTQADLFPVSPATAFFTDNTGGYGGVLSINNAITYNSTINLSTVGTGAGKGYWYLGSGSSGTFSGTAANLTVGAGGTYRLGGGGGTLTISGGSVLIGTSDVLVGSSSLNGNGAVIVNAAQTYSGKTTVTGAATLSIGLDTSLGTAPGSLTPGKLVLDNGTLQARTSFTLEGKRGIAVGPTSGSGTGTLDTNGNSVTYSGIVANNGGGTGGLTKTGSGTLTLTGDNTYSGTTGLSGGVLNFTKLDNLGIGNAIAFNGGTLQYAANNTTDITARTVTTTYVSSSATGATIDTNGNNVTFATSAITGTGSFTKSGAGTLTLNVANTYTGVTAITAGTVKLGQVNALPLTTLTLNGGTPTAGTLDVNGLDVTVSNLTGTAGSVNGRIINSASGSANILTVNSTGGSTFAGIIADNNGSGGTLALAKTGSSILTLAGANTYSGGTSVTGGALSISSDANLGTAPAAAATNIFLNGGTLSASTTFELNANRSIALGPASGSGNGTLEASAGTTLTYNGTLASNGSGTGGLIKTNTTGTLVLGGANTYAGDTALLGGTLKIANAAAIPSGSGKGNVSISSNSGGVLDLNGKAITINGLSGAGGISSGVAGAASISIGGNDATGAANTFTGAINNGTGTVSVAKIGGGTLTLSGTTSTYTGGTTITGGIVSISADNASAGNAGSLGLVPATATAGNLVINGGTLATSATLTLNSNRGIAVGPDSGNGSGTLAVGTGTTLTYGGIIANNGSGSGGLTKTNTTGSLVLSAANTYSGDTTISGGTLRLSNAAAIPSGSGKGNLTLASGSTLDLNNLSPTVNGLTGAGTVTNALAGAVTFTAGGNDAGGSFGGVIQDGNGTVALTKNGTGLLTLGGLNTYSGTTTVSSGTLQLGIASALPSGTGKGNLTLNGTLDLAGFSTSINGLSGTASSRTAQPPPSSPRVPPTRPRPSPETS